MYSSTPSSKTDLLVRQRFQNPLPAPSFPPKLLTIKTDPTRYATYDFLTPLSLEREVPMIVDSEGGMHLDQSLVPGYWESGTSSQQAGRSGKMAPDLSIDAPDLDDEDLELLVDPPGTINPASAGIMPTSSGGANLDMVGTGRSAGIIANVRSPAAALDRRKKDVAWIRRSDYAVASDAMNQAKKEAIVREWVPASIPHRSLSNWLIVYHPRRANRMAAAHHAVKPAALTPEEQMQAIIHTFSVIEKTELSNLKHPTKPHLQAVESYDILPDEELWANQYALFKFADNPNDRKSGQSVRTSFLKLSCTYTKTDVAFSDWFVLAQSQPVASS
jgi:RNA polymerase II-associated factor 1